MPLIDVLKNPQSALSLSNNMLSELLKEARYHRMSAQLIPLFEQSNVWLQLPERFKGHLLADNVAYENQQRMLKLEVERFSKLFSTHQIKCIYLKGSAYQLSEFSEFKGRMMADIDLLVDKSQIGAVEKTLKAQGFINPVLSDYDDKFYREYSQEIPPLYHYLRQTEVDVHFNLLPTTLRQAPDPTTLLAHLDPIEGYSNSYRLKPAGMFLHAAIHLFYESEYPKGLRDLFDLHMLITRFASDEFWQDLNELTQEIGNQDSIFLALRYCRFVFNTPVPESGVTDYSSAKPTWLSLYDWSFKWVLSSFYPQNRSVGFGFAEWVLYIRGHLKRMPIWLLVPHLVRKSIYRIKNANKQPNEEDDFL